MQLALFFAHIRSSLYDGKLPQSAVDGCMAILAACSRYGVVDPHHVADIMAQTHHETGGTLLPVKETVYANHEDKNPTDAVVIARLDRAWAKGQLPWVKTPYWRDGAFGRGLIQLTHWTNYEKFGKRLSINLRRNPALALELNTSAAIAVLGMSEGLFTGKKLSDFSFPDALSLPPAKHPRRIVNGQDGTDGKISQSHRVFHAALTRAGYKPGEYTPLPPTAILPEAMKPVVIPAPAPSLKDPVHEPEMRLPGIDLPAGPKPVPTGALTSAAIAIGLAVVATAGYFIFR